MFELPIFPLNTVLFPGMPLSLHVFEERYKRMINLCLEKEQPFGVVLIRRGQEALGPLAEPHEIGCTARILSVEHLDDGRMNIAALGAQRFRILSLRHDKPYLVGLADMFPLVEKDFHALSETSRALRPWVKRYMDILTQVSDIDLDSRQLPDEPLVLAYLAAVLLQVPAAQKQDLLASERAVDLLSDMHSIYRREVALLRALLTDERQGKDSSFSNN